MRLIFTQTKYNEDKHYLKLSDFTHLHVCVLINVGITYALEYIAAKKLNKLPQTEL